MLRPASAHLSRLVRSQLLMAACAPMASAATLTVGASGDHATVAAAVAAAADGDTIEIDSDTYVTEADQVLLTVDLTFTSTGGADVTAALPPLRGQDVALTLDGVTVAVANTPDGLLSGVALLGGELAATSVRIGEGAPSNSVSAVVLRNSPASFVGLSADAVRAPLIEAQGSSYVASRSVSIQDCTITNTAPESVYALVHLVDVAGTVDGCEVSTSGARDAIFLSEGGDLDVSNTSFTDVGGGGVAMLVGGRGGTYRVSDVAFKDTNILSGNINGGAVRLMPASMYGGGGQGGSAGGTGVSDFTLSNATFEGSVGSAGPDVIVFQDNAASTALIADSTFADSRGDIGGSVIIAGQATIRDSVFTRTLAQAQGGALALFGEVVVDGCTFEDTAAGLAGGAIHVWSSLSQFGDDGFPNTESFTFIDNTFSNTTANGGGVLATTPATDLLISGGEILEATAGDLGGAIYAYDQEGLLERLGDGALIEQLIQAHPIIVDGVSVVGGSARSGGVFGSEVPVEVHLLDVIVDGTQVEEAGAVGYFAGPGIGVLDGVEASGTSARVGGLVSSAWPLEEKREAAWGRGDIHLEVVDTYAVGVSVTEAGGAFNLGYGSTLDVYRSAFEDLQSSNTAAFLAAESPESVRLQCTRVCESGASKGPLMAMSRKTEGVSGSFEMSNSIVLNPTDGLGTLWVNGLPGNTVLRQNTFIGGVGEASINLQYKEGYNEITGNIFTGHQQVVASITGSLTGSHNLWFDNVSADGGAGLFPSSSAVLDEPIFWDEPSTCSAELILEDGSPGQDASVPGLLDVDGSPADIGALGGPDACFTDADGDGFTILDDCDDANPDLNPDAVDIPYDGIDQDCSGEDACDLDGDGEQSTVCGGLDCNDADSGINSSATEVPYDGIDQDCNGADACDLDGDGVLAIECGGTDCNDDDVLVYPGAEDLCYDGIDSDCALDDDYDCDGDGTIPDGYDDVYEGELPTGDCNDADDTIYPGADDPIDDGIDSDCDGTIECDVDGDGFDNATCGGDDCNDEDASINPDADEVAYDGIDQDCDETDLCDVDGDGADAEACGGDDCDDDDDAVGPAATELPYDGIDQDCDGADLCDVDGDGADAEACGGDDCDDDDADVFVGADETANDGIDQDCDGEDLTNTDETPDDGSSYVKGGCASVPATPGSGLGGLALLALAGLRRRKEA